MMEPGTYANLEIDIELKNRTEQDNIYETLQHGTGELADKTTPSAKKCTPLLFWCTLINSILIGLLIIAVSVSLYMCINVSKASNSKESIRSIAADVRNIRNDLENKTSGLDNLLVITDEINKKCEDGLSDLSKNLERQTNDLRSFSTDFDKQKNVLEDQKKEIEDLRQDINNKSSEIAAIKESMKNVSVDVANIKKDMKKLDDVKTMKDDLSELSKRLADLEKQMKELDQTLENKTQTIAFNVMDAVNYTGSDAIKFSIIILNEGDAYNKDTGIFKAPVAGIYQFNAHICGNEDTSEIEYRIMVGSNKIVTGEFTLPNRASDTKCTSFSAVALVRKGDNVRVGGMPFSHLDRINGDDLSSFSGVLIRTI